MLNSEYPQLFLATNASPHASVASKRLAHVQHTRVVDHVVFSPDATPAPEERVHCVAAESDR
jgi:hypothetical protein